MPIDHHEVHLAFQRLLHRDPESQAVVDALAANATSVDDLCHRIATSPEYAEKAFMRQLAGLDASSAPVQLDVTPAELDRLMQRVQGQWRRLGETDPYWSVLSEERYRAGRITEALTNELLAQGEASAALIDRTEARTGARTAKGTCFELGCGVGRVTYHLSRRFERVIAADISPANLAICQQNLDRLGAKNVTFLLLRHLTDFTSVQAFDFLFSVIVLQHNPPPVQSFILDALAARIRPAGGCLVQTPDALPGYSFDCARYLASDDQLIEMHALPMHAVLKTLHDNGLQTLRVTMDSWTGSPGSYTYFAVKPDGQARESAVAQPSS